MSARARSSTDRASVFGTEGWRFDSSRAYAPNLKPCRLDDLSGWLGEEAASIQDEARRRVLLEISTSLDLFVKWPKRAGLVAAHLIADALADEFAVFAWRLRAESFRRFGYDPEGVFTGQPDE